MPVLNESAGIQNFLESLPDAEIIIVDGGSDDDTRDIAAGYATVICSEKGRAKQMNAGAALATGDILLFLHADTQIPDNTMQLMQRFWVSGKSWGRFDVTLDGEHPAFRLIEFMMNWRSRITGIATGDQAMFVKRSVFERVGGFASIDLMEDIEFSRRLKSISPPLCLPQRVVTSARRWEERGILQTILLMWRLRLLYFLGESPTTLGKQYR